MTSLEKTKAKKEKKTAPPVGLDGKFSNAFSKFESSEDKKRGAKSACPLKTKAKEPEASKPVSKPTATVEPEIKSEHAKKIHAERRAMRSPPKEETQPQSPKPTAKRIERSKTFDTGIPGRSPSGSKVLERMAKFGKSIDTPSTADRTVTTKNKETERFERHRVTESSPHLDVDIQIKRQPLEGQENVKNSGSRGNKTAAITVGHNKVKVAQLDKRRPVVEEKVEEYLNVWDTQVPVTDRNKKVGSTSCLSVCPLIFFYAVIGYLI